MRKYGFIIAFILVFAASAFAANFDSIGLMNSTNYAKYFDGLYNYLYESHGCLHFTPSDIYLLTKTIPPGSELEIKEYSDISPEFDASKVPYFTDYVITQKELKAFSRIFNDYQTRLVVYPGLKTLFIIVGGQPYLKVRTNPGPFPEYRQVMELNYGKPIKWDFSIMTSTDPGKYTIMRSPSNYQSYLYYNTTVIPFGARILKRGNAWAFEKEGSLLSVPAEIAEDIASPNSQKQFNYFDATYSKSGKINSARWGSHDFGKYTLLWTQGHGRYPELGYSEGELLFDQIVLIKDLAQILTVSSTDDFDKCIASNENFKLYRNCYKYIESDCKTLSSDILPEAALYYKYFHGFELTAREKRLLDPRIIRVFKTSQKDKKDLGIYNFVKDYALTFVEKANWYKKIKADWPFWLELKATLKKDFEANGIANIRQQKALVEKWLTQRLEFQTATP